jgi:hypothetical protein
LFDSFLFVSLPSSPLPASALSLSPSHLMSLPPECFERVVQYFLRDGEEEGGLSQGEETCRKMLCDGSGGLASMRSRSKYLFLIVSFSQNSFGKASKDFLRS